jgi:hypothetical protein
MSAHNIYITYMYFLIRCLVGGDVRCPLHSSSRTTVHIWGGGSAGLPEAISWCVRSMWVENDGGRMRSGRDTSHRSRSLGPHHAAMRAVVGRSCRTCWSHAAKRRTHSGRTIGGDGRRPGGGGGHRRRWRRTRRVVRAHVPPGRGARAFVGGIVPRAYANCPRHDDRNDGGIRVRKGACRVRELGTAKGGMR